MSVPNTRDLTAPGPFRGGDESDSSSETYSSGAPGSAVADGRSDGGAGGGSDGGDGGDGGGSDGESDAGSRDDGSESDDSKFIADDVSDDDNNPITPEKTRAKILKFLEYQEKFGPTFAPTPLAVPNGHAITRVRVYVGIAATDGAETATKPPHVDMSIRTILASGIFGPLFQGEPLTQPATAEEPTLSFYTGFTGYPASEIAEKDREASVVRALQKIDKLYSALFDNGISIDAVAPVIPEVGENVPPMPLPVAALRLAVDLLKDSRGYPSYMDCARLSRITIHMRWGVLTELIAQYCTTIIDAVDERISAFVYAADDDCEM